ncbi:MAG TPA: TerC family protein [Longimicrobiaceae bacterium]|nr:TerC family protein [Longimicrobiaceae bacterium]
MDSSIWPWIGFNALVLVLLAIDLGVFNRNAHVVSVKEAARWSVITVVLALAFAGAMASRILPVENVGGTQDALEFVTGYLIELALSVDNIFVFVLIFSYFRVPAKYQHRVLFWGVLGALVMRGTMIAAGAYLIERFHWVIYVFGAFLVITGIRMATHDEADIEPEANPVLRLVRRFMPISPRYDGQKFFTTETVGGRVRTAATPLFVVLILVETTDLIFALDSIPAIFAVTTDPYLVYTSNVFAILCLRSLYFVLAGVIDKFHYLKLGLSVVLVFIGLKMLVTALDYHIPIGLSLAFVATVLAGSVVASLVWPRAVEEESPVRHDPLSFATDEDDVSPVIREMEAGTPEAPSGASPEDRG